MSSDVGTRTDQPTRSARPSPIDRATSPIATAVIVGWRNKAWPSKLGSLSLVMMVAGIGLCIDQHGAQSHGSFLGIAVAFASVISAGGMLACSSALMAADSVDPVALTCYSAPWSAMALAPFALVMEAPRFRHAATAHGDSSGLTGVALAIVASCAAASTYNICANSLLCQTSAVWMTVFGQVRLLVLLVVASFTLPGERRVCRVGWPRGLRPDSPIGPVPRRIHRRTRLFFYTHHGWMRVGIGGSVLARPHVQSPGRHQTGRRPAEQAPKALSLTDG